MIDEKKIEEAALKHSADSWLSDDCRTAFEDGFSEVSTGSKKTFGMMLVKSQNWAKGFLRKEEW